MPTRSQRPIVDRLLSVDPIKLNGLVYKSISDMLDGFNVGKVTVDELVAALKAHGVVVSVRTVYQWKRDNQ